MSSSKVKSQNRSNNVRPASTGRVRPMPRNGPPQNEPKKRVGNYLLGNTVGEGTFGKVKIAIHIPTGEKVAVKILEKKRIQDQADVRRVNREIKILKKARHSNIIQLYEVLDTPNSIYLMMENADGGEMFDYIVANRHVPERQACKFFHQILNGVEELHKNEITHRDLKPENLLLKNSPEGFLVKIVDFGLSNTHDGGRLLSTACGSPCYAAPEMIAGKQYFGPGADIWSLGVILFALVCGHLPFEDPNTSNLYRKILSGEYKTPKWISPEVKDLIRKILETDPEKRFTIDQIRAHPWCQMVPVDAIPKEEFNREESEETKQEVFKRLEEIGLDLQSVMDAVSSHACNSLSAMYYLLAQKELLKLRLSKKFSTNSARPETSGQSDRAGPSILGIGGNYGIKSLDKMSETPVINDKNPTQQSQPIQQQPQLQILEPENKPVNIPSKPINLPADPVRKPPPTIPQSGRPLIPKLNIKKAKDDPQGVPVDTLVSQSARADVSVPIGNPRGQLAALQNPHASGISTARAILTDQPPTTLLASQIVTPVKTVHNGGVLIKGSTIDNNTTDVSPSEALGVDLAIVANGLVQLPPVDAERPTTRRSKSRGAKPSGENGGMSAEDVRPEGPGMGKIPSVEIVTDQIDPNFEAPQVPKEPQAPREPPRSNGSAGGRRGKHLVQASEELPSQLQGSVTPTPPTKSKPVTTLTDPRSIYQARPGIGGKPIQPLPIGLSPRVPSAPSSKPPEMNARALAQKNKLSQQGGTISLGMEPNNPSPPTVLVS